MRRELVIGSGIAIAVVAAAIVLGSSGQKAGRPKGDCYNLGVGEVRSPDDALGLSTVVYVCEGRPDASVTNVTLTAHGKGENVLGPVFAADRDHAKAPAGPGSGPEVRVRWTAERKATIAYHHAAHVVTKTRTLGGVELTFETFR